MSVTESENQQTEVPLRDQYFNKFYEAVDLVEILESFQALCSEIGLDSTQYEGFYSSLKKELTFWKASALWQLLDARSAQPEYEGQKACEEKRVLVIGAGPVGLRSAIEAALLGARVDLVEKRTSFSRNNSLHLWPFLITDLRNLGAKKFYGKFASGTIDHICIRILQGILLKVCLLLGVKVHHGVTFTGLVEPKNANGGWTASVNPSSCPVSAYHYDVIMAADGKQNSLPGFRLKEFRAKLALAITVNFVNSNTKQESSVPEISGVAYVYKQDFFKSLAEKHGIELENIVYYKDETHYFVMTATKNSLLKKGVLKKDNSDPEQLLAKSNIDQKSLERYAVEAATFSTEGALDVKFEKNHRGENDVALFDFTSLFAADNAARIIERKGKRILLCVAGDTLIEPFWPTGSGCARGFLGAFDNAWMMKKFVAGADPIDLLEEREAILYLLPQTTPERLAKNFAAYSIDPKTRYLYLNEIIPPGDVTHLFSSDNMNAMNAAKSRSQAPSSDKTKKIQPEPQNRSVSAVEDAKPKRSRSIEGLASKAQSAESPYEPSVDEKSKGVASGATDTTQDVKEFWKRHSAKTSSQNKSQSSKNQTPTASKPPLPSSAKSHQKNLTQTSSTKKSSPRASPQPSPKTKDKTETSAKSWQKRSPSSTKSASPEPNKTSSKADSSKAKQSPKSSPKWSRFSNKGRSKSESPERETKKEKGVAGHPLEVATSLKSLDRESQGVSETEQTNVLDMIKQYNKKDEDAKGTQKQGKAATPEASKPSSKSGSKKSSSKGSKSEKEKQKQKEKHSKEEKKEASSHKGWNPFSFFKKKSYSVSEEGTAQPNKQKSKKGSKQVEEKPKVEEPLTVQGRIKQLMEHGVATDGVEDPDSSVQLVSVSPHKEEVEKDQETGESAPQEEPPPESQPNEVTEVDDNVVKSKLEESPHEVDEEDEPPVVDTMDRVKKLQSSFQKMHDSSTLPHSHSFSVGGDKMRSKEIDLSEVLSRESKEKTSHPLWLARVIQALNKCLERLRKENDVMVAKTALQILNTIFNNVQRFPDDDTYRRVRISSEQFHDKIWQFNNARQFLARSGWVEIDDFIVLPIDSKLDIPKRVLDKHLDIVNQMLWSMHLELPHAPSVVKRNAKFRDRSMSLMRRESYATRIIEESLMKVEEDKMAMAAAKMRKSRGSFGVKATPPTNLETLEEGDGEEQDEDIFIHMSTQEHRIEEVQTMKAASAARDIWKQKESESEREYRLNLETELYDLPRRKVSVEHEDISVPPSIATQTSTTTTASEEPDSPVESTVIETENNPTPEKTATTDNEIGDQLRQLTQKSNSQQKDSASSSSTSSVVTAENRTTPPDETSENNLESTTEQPRSNSKHTSPSHQTSNIPTTPTKKLSESSGSDQLRQLVKSSPIPPRPESNLSSGLGSPEHKPNDTTTREYERLTMEAAAQSRQKWKDSEAAAVTNGSSNGTNANNRPESSKEDKQEEENSDMATTL